MRKSALVVGVLGVAALALTACSGGPSTGGMPSGGRDEHRFIYITDDPIGINKFLESGKIGIEQAAKKYHGTSQTYESTDQASQRQNIEAAVAAAPDVIVLISSDLQDMAEQYAKGNPKQKFLLVDACPNNPPKNLYCAVFREWEVSYLLGIEAGMRTKTGKVGSVGALDIPFLHRYTDAFAEGARSVNPNVKDIQLWIGGSNPFSDPATGKEQALAIAALGVDQVFAVASGSNGGIFDAAGEQNMQAYGVDVNQCPMSPGHGADGTIKAVNVVVVKEIGEILAGKAKQVTSYGLSEGGMNLVSLTADAATSQCTVMDLPDVLAAVKKAKQEIIDGALVIKNPAS